jgi:hypothetical protein
MQIGEPAADSRRTTHGQDNGGSELQHGSVVLYLRAHEIPDRSCAVALDNGYGTSEWIGTRGGLKAAAAASTARELIYLRAVLACARVSEDKPTSNQATASVPTAGVSDPTAPAQAASEIVLIDRLLVNSSMSMRALRSARVV